MRLGRVLLGDCPLFGAPPRISQANSERRSGPKADLH